MDLCSTLWVSSKSICTKALATSGSNSSSTCSISPISCAWCPFMSCGKTMSTSTKYSSETNVYAPILPISLISSWWSNIRVFTFSKISGGAVLPISTNKFSKNVFFHVFNVYNSICITGSRNHCNKITVRFNSKEPWKIPSSCHL